MKIVNCVFTGLIVLSVLWYAFKDIRALKKSLIKLNALQIDLTGDTLKRNDEFKKQVKGSILKRIWLLIMTLIVLWLAGVFNVYIDMIKDIVK